MSLPAGSVRLQPDLYAGPPKGGHYLTGSPEGGHYLTGSPEGGHYLTAVSR